MSAATPVEIYLEGVSSGTWRNLSCFGPCTASAAIQIGDNPSHAFRLQPRSSKSGYERWDSPKKRTSSQRSLETGVSDTGISVLSQSGSLRLGESKQIHNSAPERLIGCWRPGGRAPAGERDHRNYFSLLWTVPLHVRL